MADVNDYQSKVQGTQNVKDLIKEEYRKCAVDPVYFMRKYCVIQHPVKGKMLFDLYPFQEQCLYDFRDNDRNIILDALRQLKEEPTSSSVGAYIMSILQGGLTINYVFK
jgi:hypothetical protein